MQLVQLAGGVRLCLAQMRFNNASPSVVHPQPQTDRRDSKTTAARAAQIYHVSSRRGGERFESNLATTFPRSPRQRLTRMPLPLVAAVPRWGSLDDDNGDNGAKRVIGRYSLCGKLGAGAMGSVYEAVEVECGQRVALKIM